MSQQAVREFLDRLTSDDDLRMQVGHTLDESQRNPDVVLDLAGGLGLEFSLDELDEALTERYGAPPGELSDAELKSVAGGAQTTFANSWGIARKGSGGVSFSFPDICKTPTPEGPVPIPYPNIGKSSVTSKGTKKTMG